MDTKLARGLTRQSIRRDRAEYPSVVRGMQVNFKPFLEKYLLRGRLKKDEASAFLKRIIAVKTDPHEWTKIKKARESRNGRVILALEASIAGEHLPKRLKRHIRNLQNPTDGIAENRIRP